MDEKKKKGKKKKGNHSKHSSSIFTAEDVNQTKLDDSVSNAEVLPVNYHDAAPEQNHHSGTPSNADSQSVGVSESDVDQEKRKNLEEKCVELQEEINKLEVEKNVWSQKEGSLEKRIKLLQNEVDSCIQKEASLEEKIDDLQSKNASLTMREANFEKRVEKMEMNQSLALEEVMELKDSRDSLAQENKQLADSISTLESRIQHLEMVASFYASSKASEIHVEPVQLAGTAENPTSEKTIKHSSTVKSSTSTDYASEFHKSIFESNEKIETMAKANESCSINGIENFDSMEQLQQIQLLGLDDSRISEDVVSVPLDDIIQELQATAEKIESEPVVPLSDAPLIGAPFRLISFVARFVSGADLVDPDKPKADR